MKRLGMTALAACSAFALTVGFAGSASAVVVSTSHVAPPPITDPSDLRDPTSASAGVLLDQTGSVTNVRKSPYFGTAFADTAIYHSVSAGASATYDFGSTQSLFELMWGSPDGFNTLEFLLGNTTVHTMTGAEVDNPPAPGTGFVNVAVSDLLFDSVRFSSTENAFEFTNVSAVPLPASLLLLLSALGGLGFLSRRKTAFAAA